MSFSKRQIFEKTVQSILGGRPDELKNILDTYPWLTTERYEGSPGDPSLLHFVAANGVADHYQVTPPNILEIAKILLEAGAVHDLHSTIYGEGSTPMVALVSSAHPFNAGVQEALVDLFVEYGVPVDGYDGLGMPLATALSFWYPGAANTLIRCGARCDNIIFAAAAAKLKLLTAWEDNGSWNSPLRFPEPFKRKMTKEEEINTAFVKAALCDQISVLEYFIRKNVSVNTISFQGQTGLHEAAYRGKQSTLKFLLDHGADPTIKDKQFNSTPLGWAEAGGREDFIEILS